MAAVVAVGLVPADARGKAMGIVAGGFTLANILGLPAGTVIGQHLGWRAAFWTVAALSAVAMLGRGALAELRREHVGFVFQTYNLIPSLTARENVALPARLAKRALSPSDVDAALIRVGLGGFGGYRPAALSGGQQQRVAVARVLALRPDVVFADEPTGALDTAAGEQVLRLLRDIASDGQAVVMVTHDLQAAARADRVVVLRDGIVDRELPRPHLADIFEAVARAGNRV